MASITYNPGINSSNPYVTMTVTESSYSVANNTSVVAWNLKLYRPSNISSSANKAYKIVVNGTTVKSGNTTIGGSGTKTIASGTSTISHNADGSKSISFSFSLTMDITWSGTKIGTASKSGSLKLTNIPRATTPTVSASSVDMGNSVTVNMPRASSSFTHTLQYTFAGTTTTIATGLGTSKAWSIPITLANSIPNATSGTLTFTCITYNGSTKIGSKTVSITAKVPASVAPTLSLSYSEAVAKVASTYGVYVKGLSKLAITASGAGSYSSTIKSYKIVANGATYTTATATTGVLSSSGNMTITATVTDSRGRTKTDSKTISVSNYASPTISGFSASRVNDGDDSNNNDNLSVVIKGSVTSLSGNNSTYKLECKKSSDSAYPSAPMATGSLTNYAVDTTVTLTGIDKDSSYDLRLTITDAYGNSTPKSISVPTEFTLVDYHSSGKGLAFGKVAEISNAFECNMPIYDRFDKQIGNGLSTNANTTTENPDTTLEHVIVTNYNTPANNYMYVITYFYAGKATTNSRSQIAIPYHYVGEIYYRCYYNGWKSWTKVTYDGSTRTSLTVSGTSSLTTLNVSGNTTLTGWLRPNGALYLLNGIALRTYASGNSSYYNALYTDSSNNTIISNTSLNTYYYGKNIYFEVASGGRIYLQSATTLNHQMNLGSDKASDGNNYYINNKATARFNSLKYASSGGYSSRRYKNSIEYKDSEYWHDAIIKMKPCTYYYNNDDKTKKLGLIAEDLVELIPELVGLDEENKPSSVEYANLTIPLISEVQRLNNIVDSQQKEIEELKALVNNLIDKVGRCM